MDDFTFTVSVTSTEHSEWQGHIITADNRRLPFRSLLELIKAIDKEMEEEPTCK